MFDFGDLDDDEVLDVVEDEISDVSVLYAGDIVKGYFMKAQWYSATVQKDNGDGTYTVEWNDGDAKDLVKPLDELKLVRRAKTAPDASESDAKRAADREAIEREEAKKREELEARNRAEAEARAGEEREHAKRKAKEDKERTDREALERAEAERKVKEDKERADREALERAVAKAKEDEERADRETLEREEAGRKSEEEKGCADREAKAQEIARQAKDEAEKEAREQHEAEQRSKDGRATIENAPNDLDSEAKVQEKRPQDNASESPENDSEDKARFERDRMEETIEGQKQKAEASQETVTVSLTESSRSNECVTKEESGQHSIEECIEAEIARLREEMAEMKKELQAACDVAAIAEQTLEDAKKNELRLVVEMKQREDSLHEALALAEQEASRLEADAIQAEREWREILEPPDLDVHAVSSTPPTMGFQHMDISDHVDPCIQTGGLERDSITLDRSTGIPSELLDSVSKPDPTTIRRFCCAAEPATCTDWCTSCNADGSTLLHLAAMTPPSNRSFVTATLLLQLRAQVDRKNHLGETPLCLAVGSALHNGHDLKAESRMRTTRLLLERHADVNILPGIAGEFETLLAKAVSSNDAIMCNLLIRHGALSPPGAMNDDQFAVPVERHNTTSEDAEERQSAGPTIPAERKPDERSVLHESAKPPPVEPIHPSALLGGRWAPHVKATMRESSLTEPVIAPSPIVENIGKRQGIGVPVAKAKPLSKVGAENLGVERLLRSSVPEASKPVQQNSERTHTLDGSSGVTKGMASATQTASPGIRLRGTAPDEKTAPFAKQNRYAPSVATPTGYQTQGPGFPPSSSSKASAKPKAKKKAVAKKPVFRQPESDNDSYNSFGHDPKKLPPRTRKVCMQFPGYSGELPPLQEAEELWTDQEIHCFFFSSGFIRPNKKKKKVTKILPQAALTDHKETLGLPFNAGIDVVRKSYRKLALRYHPDKNPEEQDASRFQEISDAYEAICQHHRELQERS